MRRRQSRKTCNFLPESIGAGFEKDLRILIEELAGDGTFRSAYLRDEVFSKYLDEGLVPADERAAAAIEKWLAVEDKNRTTNERIYLSGDVNLGWSTDPDDPVTDGRIFAFAAEIIESVLGPFSNFWSWAAGASQKHPMGSHTNGASTRVNRSEIAAILKHSGKAHITREAIPYWYVLSAGTKLEDQELSLVEGSVLFTVPKKTDIDRVACKEPEINMFLQRIVGGHIRRRLRKNGIDLNDQSINQGLAMEAKARGLATVDLSSASDSISTMLVMRLLPFDWYSMLDDIRVKQTQVNGVSHELEMFSSMGNGFTFELESLIFWALTRSICRFSGVSGRISVYGDDIICPASVVPRLARFFSYCGFSVNLKKSHWTGGFRESCGKHYYFGSDVSPFYVRGKVSSMTDLIKTLNQLMVWGSEGSFIIYDEILRFHQKWANIVPRNLWGGVDPEDIGALVTGHAPRKRIVARNLGYRESDSWHQGKSDESYSEAGLLCWFTVRESTSEVFDTSSARQRGFRVTGYPDSVEHTLWRPWLMAATECAETPS